MNQESKNIRFYLTGTLESRTMNDFIDFVQGADIGNGEFLEIWIQSDGGSVAVGLALADFIMSLPCKVMTYNMSNIDSAALPIFAAGEERLCSDTAIFTVHPIGRLVSDTLTEKMIRMILREIVSDQARVAFFLSTRTNVSAMEWRRMMRNGKALSSMEAHKMGLVSRID